MNMNMFNINKFYYSLYNSRRFQGEGSNGYTTDRDKLIKLEIQIRSIFFNSRHMLRSLNEYEITDFVFIMIW